MKAFALVWATVLLVLAQVNVIFSDGNVVVCLLSIFPLVLALMFIGVARERA